MNKYRWVVPFLIGNITMALLCYITGYFLPAAVKSDRERFESLETQPANVMSDGGRFQSLSTLRTTDESLKCMYGEGKGNSEYDDYLLDYVRSLTSRPSLSRGRNLTKISPDGQYSTLGGSQYVDKLLKQRRNGFYVEVGAFRGEALSDTLFFELKRNWTGLLIEANPEYHHEILQKNRDAFVLRACLSISRSAATMKFKLADRGSGIESVNRNYKTQATAVTDVQCFSLNSVLAAIDVRHVDFMVLDVEGAELPVLQSIDWHRFSFDVFIIEYREVKPEDSVKKLNTLRSFFSNRTAVYKEAGTMPWGRKESNGVDVIFMRTSI